MKQSSEKTKANAKAIGSRIRLARLDKKFTAEEVAGKLGISLKTYLNLEKGATGTALGTFLAAIEILELDFSEAIPSSKLSNKRVKRTPSIDDDEVDF